MAHLKPHLPAEDVSFSSCEHGLLADPQYCWGPVYEIGAWWSNRGGRDSSARVSVALLDVVACQDTIEQRLRTGVRAG